MNGNFDGVNRMYGSVQFLALAELSRLLKKTGGQNGAQGSSWKRVTLALAVIAAPVALLLAGGLGS